MEGKLIIFSAPSGSGKTTIVRELLKHYPQFEFSISATSRAPRGVEQNGVDYYFLTQEEFAVRAGLGLRFVRDLEQGKQTVRMDKVNQALAMFGMKAVPGKDDR